MLYSPNRLISKCKKSYSNNGSLLPTYYMISINNSQPRCNITINNLTGQLYFNNIKRGKYLIIVLNGTQFQYSPSSNYYTFINYNGLTKKLIDELEKDGNPFDDTFIIVDEVHNFISRIANGSTLAMRIYNFLINAKDIKMVLLSGTPIINQSRKSTRLNSSH